MRRQESCDTARPLRSSQDAGSSYFAVGAAKLGIGTFNQLLAANGLPTQDTRTGLLGAGATVSFGPLLVGISGQAVFSDERSNATYRTRTPSGRLPHDRDNRRN